MLNRILGEFPQGMVIICTILSFLIPFTINTINARLHKYGDPPWKAVGKQEDETDPPSGGQV
ncbi:hypothetical protein [Paenibacillus aestuarii]|uniref:Uncharacterized protein n=1 Tax=Paenibacillus aestuarii TaxID=516965 RepID=A0ABW0KBJ9_9BACL|nr:hypothetical protein [Paenibacillus aestuarii]